MNKERLLKLADFLDQLPNEKFDFGVVRCGSKGCAIGWCPSVFPDLVRPSANDQNVELMLDPGADYIAIARELFDLGYYEASELFSPSDDASDDETEDRPWTDVDLTSGCSPRDVARSIRDFVAWKEPG